MGRILDAVRRRERIDRSARAVEQTSPPAEPGDWRSLAPMNLATTAPVAALRNTPLTVARAPVVLSPLRHDRSIAAAPGLVQGLIRQAPTVLAETQPGVTLPAVIGRTAARSAVVGVDRTLEAEPPPPRHVGEHASHTGPQDAAAAAPPSPVSEPPTAVDSEDVADSHPLRGAGGASEPATPSVATGAPSGRHDSASGLGPDDVSSEPSPMSSPSPVVPLVSDASRRLAVSRSELELVTEPTYSTSTQAVPLRRNASPPTAPTGAPASGLSRGAIDRADTATVEPLAVQPSASSGEFVRQPGLMGRIAARISRTPTQPNVDVSTPAAAVPAEVPITTPATSPAESAPTADQSPVRAVLAVPPQTIDRSAPPLAAPPTTGAGQSSLGLPTPAAHRQHQSPSSPALSPTPSGGDDQRRGTPPSPNRAVERDRGDDVFDGEPLDTVTASGEIPAENPTSRLATEQVDGTGTPTDGGDLTDEPAPMIDRMVDSDPAGEASMRTAEGWSADVTGPSQARSQPVDVPRPAVSGLGLGVPLQRAASAASTPQPVSIQPSAPDPNTTAHPHPRPLVTPGSRASIDGLGLAQPIDWRAHDSPTIAMSESAVDRASPSAPASGLAPAAPPSTSSSSTPAGNEGAAAFRPRDVGVRAPISVAAMAPGSDALSPIQNSGDASPSAGSIDASHRPPQHAIVVGRAEETGSAPVADPPPVSDPAMSGGEVSGPPSAPVDAQENTDELADELYRRLSRRLRMDLQLEQERKGQIGGSW
ncbi:MAG: hypothetical protein AAF467_08485 [Actinomycetota bacterium]